MRMVVLSLAAVEDPGLHWTRHAERIAAQSMARSRSIFRLERDLWHEHQCARRARSTSVVSVTLDTHLSHGQL